MRKKILGIVLSVLLITQFTGMTSVAAECSDNSAVFEDIEINEYPRMNASYGAMLISSDGIVSANIFLSYSSNGLLAQFTTAMSDTASVVGVKDIKIYQDVWYGWKQVGTSSGGYDTNKSAFGCGVTYTGASAGQTFKASCVHYGTINGVSYELPNETSGFTCVDPNN